MKPKNEFKVGQVYKYINGKLSTVKSVDSVKVRLVSADGFERSFQKSGLGAQALTLVEDVKEEKPKDRFVFWSGKNPDTVSRFFPSFKSAEVAAIDEIKFESVQSYLILKVVGEVKEQSSTVTVKFE